MPGHVMPKRAHQSRGFEGLPGRFSGLVRRTFEQHSERGNSSQTPSDGEFLRKMARSSRGQWRRIALAGVLFWGLYALILGSGGTVHYYKLKNRAGVLERSNVAMVAQRDSLDRFITGFDGGDVGLLEKVAREKYEFVRPNERIYRVPK
jgi:cell division protein FtsB